MRARRGTIDLLERVGGHRSVRHALPFTGQSFVSLATQNLMEVIDRGDDLGKFPHGYTG
jgi:hypothetical protein